MWGIRRVLFSNRNSPEFVPPPLLIFHNTPGSSAAVTGLRPPNPLAMGLGISRDCINRPVVYISLTHGPQTDATLLHRMESTGKLATECSRCYLHSGQGRLSKYYGEVKLEYEAVTLCS